MGLLWTLVLAARLLTDAPLFEGPDVRREAICQSKLGWGWVATKLMYEGMPEWQWRLVIKGMGSPMILCTGQWPLFEYTFFDYGLTVHAGVHGEVAYVNFSPPRVV